MDNMDINCQCWKLLKEIDYEGLKEVSRIAALSHHNILQSIAAVKRRVWFYHDTIQTNSFSLGDHLRDQTSRENVLDTYWSTEVLCVDMFQSWQYIYYDAIAPWLQSS